MNKKRKAIKPIKPNQGIIGNLEKYGLSKMLAFERKSRLPESQQVDKPWIWYLTYQSLDDNAKKKLNELYPSKPKPTHKEIRYAWMREYFRLKQQRLAEKGKTELELFFMLLSEKNKECEKRIEANQTQAMCWLDAYLLKEYGKTLYEYLTDQDEQE